MMVEGPAEVMIKKKKWQLTVEGQQQWSVETAALQESDPTIDNSDSADTITTMLAANTSSSPVAADDASCLM